jgi:hypothetical protein
VAAKSNLCSNGESSRTHIPRPRPGEHTTSIRPSGACSGTPGGGIRNPRGSNTAADSAASSAGAGGVRRPGIPDRTRRPLMRSPSRRPRFPRSVRCVCSASGFLRGNRAGRGSSRAAQGGRSYCPGRPKPCVSPTSLLPSHSITTRRTVLTPLMPRRSMWVQYGATYAVLGIIEPGPVQTTLKCALRCWGSC